MVSDLLVGSSASQQSRSSNQTEFPSTHESLPSKRRKFNPIVPSISAPISELLRGTGLWFRDGRRNRWHNGVEFSSFRWEAFVGRRQFCLVRGPRLLWCRRTNWPITHHVYFFLTFRLRLCDKCSANVQVNAVCIMFTCVISYKQLSKHIETNRKDKRTAQRMYK